jgi:CheY-like chemotaxis protein
LSNVFEAFQQADSTTTRKQGGLGLGLAIAKQLLSMHKGAITAHSAGPGQGSTFTITLPLASPRELTAYTEVPQARSEQASSLPQEKALSDLRVLVADDDRNTLELVYIVLTRSGAEVKTAPTASEALKLLTEWKPDVLLSDISMPDRDGYALVRDLRTLPSHLGGATPAAALTAMASDEDKVRALAAGFQTHIPKPIEPASLVQAVARLARRAASLPFDGSEAVR